ncbi:transglutaminase domain-containing protein [Aequorivita sp. SDUM287046]|uniref:Transglutaminase domain-containing protein n=1 Tax=Aequorivita aurantiaca TaxID=3053356 RepID=A0ABT8DCN3_9FLAO|nr:transglutaminase domain-containing protein [Aequorivita aurantiaca]MDN3722880.1 transglutaminase domain-containing protein [Aequorivita aurantiaca]
MRTCFILLLFLGFGINCVAQIGAVIGNDNYPQKNHSTKTERFSTSKLAFSITRNATSDAEKAAEIFKWITQNISYDHELMRNKKLQKQFYTSEENVIKKVLERRMALCGGFAFLFKKLCADVSISSEVIHGFTKKYSGKVQNRIVPEHTWNAVKLNGKWHLLDITWAISHGTAKNPDSFWYLVKPAEFILSHYPENEKWTLLKNPTSFLEFQQHAKK